jgi:hypothetical protein
MPKTINNTPMKLDASARALCFEYIVSSVLQFKRTSYIIEEVQKKWDLSSRVIETKIKKAKEYIGNRPLEDPNKLINKHIAAREELLRNAEHIRDKLDILKDIAKLQGISDDKLVIEHRKAKDVKDDKLIELLADQ